MLLTDVNVLVYAHREDAPDHRPYRSWLENLLQGPGSYAVNDLVLSGVTRIVTHPRIFDPPSTSAQALSFVTRVRDRANAVPVAPGRRHWDIFLDLCRRTDARGNLVPDAYLAALAIETGSEWVTTDRDYARFPGLRWRHPLFVGS
ncbi:MAG: type II toxin-antitoxin system VapC family toxin [Egibacteraceae bacterium]